VDWGLGGKGGLAILPGGNFSTRKQVISGDFKMAIFSHFPPPSTNGYNLRFGKEGCSIKIQR